MSKQFTPILNYSDSLLKSIDENGGGGGGGGDLTDYLKKVDAENTYQHKGNYLTEHQSLAGYLKTEDADKKYEKIGGAGDLSQYLKSADAKLTYITKTDGDKKYQPIGSYVTTTDIQRNVVKYEDVKVPYHTNYGSFGQMIAYMESRKTGWSYDGDEDLIHFADTQMKDMWNYYQVKPEITVDEANDKLYFKFNTKRIKSTENKPLYGSVIVFDSTGPNGDNKSSFAVFLKDTVGGQDHLEYWKPQENWWLFGDHIVNNIRWDDNDTFEVDYNYSAGYRINLETIETFFFSKVPQIISVHWQEVNLLENTLNKGKPNGYVPINEFGKIDARYLPNSPAVSAPNPSINENEIDSTLKAALEADGITLLDEYKSAIIDAQNNCKKVNDITFEFTSDTTLKLKSSHLLAQGSVIRTIINDGEERPIYFIIHTHGDGFNNFSPVGVTSSSTNIWTSPNVTENDTETVHEIVPYRGGFTYITSSSVDCWCYTLKDYVPVNGYVMTYSTAAPIAIYGGKTWKRIGTITVSTQNDTTIWRRTA